MKVVAALALVVAVGAVGVGGVAHAQPRALERSELDAMIGEQPPQVVLLTFGVGPRIFEKFGHAALCLEYVETAREPVCFNYGVTTFDEGASMIWGFLRSVQKFWVDPEAWSDMIGFYQDEDRDIYEQVLPLTAEQARMLEREILTSLEEKHRYYHYDHFFNNCTTRLRDMIDRATAGKLHEGSAVAYPLTFREMGHRGLAGLPPLIALADFVLGRQLDDKPSLWQAMFHPDVLRQHVTTALGVPPRLIYKRQGEPFPTGGSTWRWPMLVIALVFTLPLVLALRLRSRTARIDDTGPTWRRRFERIALAWATIYLALWGLIVWGLAIVSSIPGVRWNENLLVLVPLDIVLPFLGAERRRRYARVRVAGLFLVSALCGAGVLHQPLWIPILSALLPLSIIAFDQKIASARA
ncbi:MAG TPA: DUF4105 domain-containing protein [Kofleriaceae bacterium]